MTNEKFQSRTAKILQDTINDIIDVVQFSTESELSNVESGLLLAIVIKRSNEYENLLKEQAAYLVLSKVVVKNTRALLES